MRLLAFETTGPLPSLALYATPSVRRVVEAASREGFADRIVVEAVDLLRVQGWPSRTLDCLAVTTGPGGFTAVRAGIAAARGLALALDLPVVALGSLELLARADKCPRPTPCVVVQDARRNAFYVGKFGGDGRPMGAPVLIDHADLEQELAGFRRVLGDVACLPAGIRERAEAHSGAPHASLLAWIAGDLADRGETGLPGFEVHPMYVRAPDAHPAAGLPLASGRLLAGC